MRGRFLRLIFLATVALAAPARGFALDQKDREFQECAECPVMVGIPAGTFTMGSPQSESGRFDSEGPQHSVEIKAFALGKFDVSSEEFLTFLKQTGYQPAPCNAMLDMRWHSPGHGLATPPLRGRPSPLARGLPRLARRSALHRLAQRQGAGRASVDGSRARPISLAE